MKHSGAIAILITMFLGIMGWGGTQIINNGNRITKVETEKTYIIKKLDKIDSKLDKALER